MSVNDAPDSQELQHTSGSDSLTKTDAGPSQSSKSLNEIIQMAQKKGEQTRSASTSLDNLAKTAWQKSTPLRRKIKKGLNIAYSVVTGFTSPEVRNEMKKYFNNLQPPNSKK